jgi:hypothetical protein
MARFEDQLWSDLVQHHGAGVAVANPPPQRRTRAALLTGGTVCVGSVRVLRSGG